MTVTSWLEGRHLRKEASMRSVLWAAAAALVVLGGSAPTFAQMGESKMYAPYFGYSAPAPRAKRYYYRSRDPGPRYYYRSGDTRTCGEFRYWNGQRCLDARTSPPDLKPGRG
jgi:hypothetical protein